MIDFSIYLLYFYRIESKLILNDNIISPQVFSSLGGLHPITSLGLPFRRKLSNPSLASTRQTSLSQFIENGKEYQHF